MKVAVDAGHGLFTQGKRCLKSLDGNETREWALNDRIATRVVDLLEARGIDTLRLDDVTGREDVPLANRVAKANLWGADFCVSIHHNAGIDGGTGGGAVVYVYSGNHSEKSDTLQSDVYHGIIAQAGKFGNRAQPLASGNFYMVRETKMPAVLVEVGFMDSKTDVPLILDEGWAYRVAEGIAKGICKSCGVDWVDAFRPSLARVTADVLNIRESPSATAPIVGKLVAGEVMRIAEVEYNGKTPWGLLNLGLGWISLGYTEAV